MWEEPKRLVAENLDDFLDYFKVEYKKHANTYNCICPFHEGAEKMGGYVIYRHPTHSVHICLTECPRQTKKDNITFIYKLLNKSGYASYEETIKFIYEFLNKEAKYEWRVDPEQIEKNVFCAAFEDPDPVRTIKTKISREEVRAKLLIPSEYYIGRGYSPQILNEYDVGLCIDKKKKFFGRTIIPCYDDSGTYYAGCTARSLFEKCDKCKHHHDPKKFCPVTDYEKWKTKKWLHMGISPKETVFNVWKAKDEIRKTRKAVITEGPGDCIRCASLGIKNVLGVYGNSLKEGQIQLLDSLGVMDLVVLLDNDKAGLEMGRQIKEDCGRFYRLYFPKLRGVKDAGELQTDEETADIKKLLHEIGI